MPMVGIYKKSANFELELTKKNRI